MDVMKPCGEDDIYTGDILLYHSNAVNSNIQRLFTDSMWNHVGVAVRLSDPNDYMSVIQGKNGFLCSMDFINTVTPDVITRTITSGLNLIPIAIMKSRYARIAVRPLKEEYRDYYIVTKILDHIEKFKKDKFVTNPITMLGPLLGTSIKTNTYSSFCSENVGHFLANMGESIPINDMGLLAPRDFIPDMLELAKYRAHMYILQSFDTSLSSNISPIIIITLFFLIIITYLLPRNFVYRQNI